MSIPVLVFFFVAMWGHELPGSFSEFGPYESWQECREQRDMARFESMSTSECYAREKLSDSLDVF